MLYEDASSGESSTYMHLVNFPLDVMQSAATSPESFIAHGKSLLSALFDTEVVKRIDMGIYKTAKSVPTPTRAEDIEAGSADMVSVLAGTVCRPSQASGWDRAVWTDSQCCIEFLGCMYDAVTKYPTLIGSMAFDKDDDLAMRLVCAASNLRSRVFSIPPMSYHDAKGVAGNIIPAIATTNAIVAGLQVLQAVKILRPGITEDEKVQACPHTYCMRIPTRRGYYLQPTIAEEPDAGCYVCSTAMLSLQVGTQC